ncbi:MAG: hypothetical protein ACYC64_07805 [Armatimonadota bacterium]
MVLNYYEVGLKSLFRKLKIVHAKPNEETALCLEIQETLVRKITYVEKRIRSLRSEIKLLKAELGVKRSTSHDKTLASRAKRRIRECRDCIQDYYNLLILLKSVGDGLVFTYIDKWDVKPLTYHESPGFISGKKGAFLERRYLRQLFANGQVAILNDLTNSLRYGDITLITESGMGLVEVKSSLLTNRRTRRQSEALGRITDYLSLDRVSDLYRPGIEIRRTSLHCEERHNRDAVNALINRVYASSASYTRVEDGLIYFAQVAQCESDLSGLEDLICDARLGNTDRWMGFFINSFKYSEPAYYPHTLSIEDTQALFDFFNGTLFILVMINTDYMFRKLNECNLKLTITKNQDRMLVVDCPLSLEPETGPLWISEHFFTRVAAEFLSLDWFLEEIIHKARNIWDAFPDLLYPDSSTVGLSGFEERGLTSRL